MGLVLRPAESAVSRDVHVPLSRRLSSIFNIKRRDNGRNNEDRPSFSLDELYAVAQETKKNQLTGADMLRKLVNTGDRELVYAVEGDSVLAGENLISDRSS